MKTLSTLLILAFSLTLQADEFSISIPTDECLKYRYKNGIGGVAHSKYKNKKEMLKKAKEIVKQNYPDITYKSINIRGCKIYVTR